MPEIVPMVSGGLAHYQIDTTLGGRPFTLVFRWNGRDGAWYMDVLRTDQTAIAHGLKLVMGTFIGSRSADADMPGVFVVRDSSQTYVDAGFDDIGYTDEGQAQRVQLYFLTFVEAYG